MPSHRKKSTFLKKYRIILVGISGFAVIVSGVFFIKQKFHAPAPKVAVWPITLAPSEDIDFEALKERWSNRIDEVGAVQAYDEFTKAYTTQDFRDQHRAMHIMGTLLYQKMGVSGFDVCDFSYFAGCIHSFAAAYIRDKGPDAIPLMLDLCEKQHKTMGCSLGMGGGIAGVDKVYNNVDNLKEAFALCLQYEKRDKAYGGCPRTLILGYHFQKLENLSKKDFTASSTDTASYYKPCDELSGDLRPACYFTQVIWWTNIFGGDYARVGRQCDALSGEEYNACFSGIGSKIALEALLDTDHMIADCDKMPGTKQTVLCQRGTIEQSLAYNKPNAAQMVCDRSTQEGIQELCRTNFEPRIQKFSPRERDE